MVCLYYQTSALRSCDVFICLFSLKRRFKLPIPSRVYWVQNMIYTHTDSNDIRNSPQCPTIPQLFCIFLTSACFFSQSVIFYFPFPFNLKGKLQQVPTIFRMVLEGTQMHFSIFFNYDNVCGVLAF